MLQLHKREYNTVGAKIKLLDIKCQRRGQWCNVYYYCIGDIQFHSEQNLKSLDTLRELAAYPYHDRVTIRRLIYG